MKGMKIGYVRVSAEDQNPDRQLHEIELDKKFVEKASGKDTNRPQLQSLMEFIREGDHLFVHSLDRLARNLHDLRSIVQELVKKGVEIHFMKENLVFNSTANPMSIFLLSVMGAFAEFERSIIKERQMEGIALAKKKGIYRGGRKKELNKEKLAEILRRIEHKDAKTKIAKDFNISTNTLYRYLREHKLAKIYV